MKTFIAVAFSIGVLMLLTTLCLCMLSFFLEGTEIGNAVRDFILSKIVDEKPKGTIGNAPIKPTHLPYEEIAGDKKDEH